MTGAMRTAVGAVVTLAAAAVYAHGIVSLGEWNDQRIADREEQSVTASTPWTMDKQAPPEPEPEPVGDPAQVDVGVVIEPLPEEPPATADVCHEDEPCWDCETMGNGVCGPPVVEQPVIHEDEPEWDCATMGNLTCGVGTDWGGLLVGDVIVCPPGLEVSIDYYPNGVSWAGCM